MLGGLDGLPWLYKPRVWNLAPSAFAAFNTPRPRLQGQGHAKGNLMPEFNEAERDVMEQVEAAELEFRLAVARAAGLGIVVRMHRRVPANSATRVMRLSSDTRITISKQ